MPFKDASARKRHGSMHAGLTAALALPLLVQAVSAQSVDFSASLNRVDGFGFSAAFGQASALQALPPAKQREVLDLLFSREKGAGFDILRLGINTDGNLEPVPPTKAGAKPHYIFDGSDGGQVWFAEQAQHYGAINLTADAWTAPAFMKTSAVQIGGRLCGEPGVVCTSGDWRADFGRYLLQYVRFYGEKGLHIRSIGFANEPDIHVSYASMDVSASEAVDFLHVFGPAVRSSGLNLAVVCCDASKWDAAKSYTAAVEEDPDAAALVQIVTAHEYGSHAIQPIPTQKPVWMTEWSSGLLTFEPRWDCNGCYGGADGMYLAQDVLQAFNQGHISAYLYWWGAGNGPAALIQIAGNDYTVAKRFYAIATISRFVLPGAVLVPVTIPDEALVAAGFRNPGGGRVLSILNTGQQPKELELRVDPSSQGAVVRTYLTDAEHTMGVVDFAQLHGSVLSLKLPPRSLCSIILSAR